MLSLVALLRARGSARATTPSSATQIAICALFATSLNLLLGTTGLVSFGHAAYFGIGAYACGILMKKLGVPFLPRFPGGRRDRGGSSRWCSASSACA